MLVSTWNTSTDRAVAFRFPSLQSVAGEISVGHTAYKNRSVATLDFSALTAAGGDPHRQPLVGNGFLDLHAGPSPTLRTDLERDRLQL
mgnify:CR=1 FL=1